MWLVALAVGWSVAALAGATEDLISAAERGDAAMVQALLAKGANANANAANGGATALMMASQEGRLEVVQVLLDKEPPSMPRRR